MQTFLIALAVFGVAMALMAVGVIFSNRRIKGSCGGLNNMKDSHGRPMCGICSNPDPDCSGENAEREKQAAADRHL